ncbi:hypothetical protein B1813_02975 [Saccharomonospora piscinae]|uniref:Uncharacterized protein n=1 Tax=Saccharomonospora piscinae TaxID=687388 RepID=A0A1V9ADA8_SACPI|nr:hypothetical protein [Saccharomonospora piscinae]OQO95036.1 hypothetical protein B1813_02975 [Saccharomonospora piscinae]
MALALGFGVVSGVVAAARQGWWGLLAAALTAGAVYGTVVVTSVVLGTGANATETAPSVGAQELYQRCLLALRELPVADPGVRAGAGDVLLLVNEVDGTGRASEVDQVVGDLRVVVEQLERMRSESSDAELLRKLHVLAQSLENSISDARRRIAL